ncbi:septin-interacting protein 1 [Anopheles merus]|uniref:septin-interacting protein 1 n=1 Tax=Anopheles merus TaxID=30066 RepID=UPI001BE48FD0|nr:septin-interacting protein 1 [Anopheles merus]
MDDEEYERFEITDYDLANEFNPNRGRRRPTKNQQIYGVWADDDSENEGDEGSGGRRRGRMGGKQPKDYSAPIGFIAGGIQQSGKKPEKDRNPSDEDDDDEGDEANDARPRFGSKAAAANSSATSSESEDERRPPPQDMRSMAGFRTLGSGAPPKAQGGKHVGNWEQHTRGIGAKLLLQMGYQPGKGLGKDLQGISAPIEAHLRKGRGAIGAYGPEKKTVVADAKQKQKQDDTKALPAAGGKEEETCQWRKEGGKQSKSRYFFKSVEDVIEKGKKTATYAPFDKSSSKLAQVTVIDMTGPEKRVLSGYHALGQAKVADEELYELSGQAGGKPPPAKETIHFALPELLHNLNLMVEYCEQDIITIDKQKCEAKDREEQLLHEKQNLIRISELEKDYLHTLDGALELVRALVEPAGGSIELEECERIFVRLYADYPAECKEFGLSDLAAGVVAPLLASRLREWNPFSEPTRHLDIFKRWKSILASSRTDTVNSLLDPYSAVVWSGVVPSIRSAASEWNPRAHQPMIALLDAWAPLLPAWILDNVLEQIVLVKLTAAVIEWDPLTDTVPIHCWIHPWTELLGPKMEGNIYPAIREKLARALKGWHPEDRSARAMLTPWKGVFAEEDLQVFLAKNIIPKLELRLTELIVNPLQQDLEIFNQVWEWHELISPLQMATVLDKYFFPKWLQTLVIWLNQSPNFDQVSRWYQGWKAQFTDDVVRHPNIKECFRKALELMQRSIGLGGSGAGGPSSSPPVMESIPPPPKPPTVTMMDMQQLDTQPTLEFKELVSQKCAERGIIFAPMPGRRELGKQVYRVGKLFCYIDRSVCIVSPDGGVSWTPISLAALLERAVSG